MSVAFSAAPVGPATWNWPIGRRFADWTIGVIAFLGAFVIAEPAPYDLLLVPVIVVWTIFGLRLNRHLAPMAGLLILYVAGGILALTQITDFSKTLIYVVTTGFLIVSAIFFAAVVAEAPERRLRIIVRAYIVSAVIASILGIAGYFDLFPGADAFTLYDRIKGTFQDPNVFGPFLVLPIVVLFRDILTHPLRASFWKAGVLLLLLFAEFLAFSRAAWGMTLFAVLLVALLSYLSEPRQVARFRIVAYLVVGLAVVAAMIAVALSIPAISDLFAERAQLVESYDAGPFGRFGRQALGFFLVQEKPLGIGPFVFARLFGEDEHNMWLKGFTTYGWLGGFSYIVLALWTLVAATPLVFKPRPWQPLVQCIYVVFLGHLVIHNVIDNDHWRHIFLIYGMLWGAIAAEKIYARDQRRVAAQAARSLLAPGPSAPQIERAQAGARLTLRTIAQRGYSSVSAQARV